MMISGIARAEEATPTDLTFLHNRKYAQSIDKTLACACIMAHESDVQVPDGCIRLSVADPYLALALVLQEMYSVRIEEDMDKDPIIEDGCRISSSAHIGKGCVIRRGTTISHNATILSGVEIGELSYIEPNVTIGFSIIGSSAYIKAGARIGQQGFGFHIGSGGITDVLQIGCVIIGNNVNIGANCTIDRGSMRDTVIGNNVRIDDMVHIAHNVEIGDYCVIAAQTGIAGSTKIGKACVFGGQVGIAGHITIGDNVVVAAKSGIMRDVQSGAKIGGIPGIGLINWHRQNAILKRLVQNRGELYHKDSLPTD
jgi:UDP-3-O-[3-hydroxymyristoyl] glucosamine N-acyltransferase